MSMIMGRRAALATGAAALSGFAIGTARAQGAPIGLGARPPLTGVGGPYGPPMLKAMQAVVDEVNAAGGVKGRPVRLVVEDDQTNPDAGVRGARKLIDVDKVSCIMGTWASSVTTAVGPLCWDNKVMLFTVSGADSITNLPHQGYIIRTQPNSKLQMSRQGKFLVEQGFKRVFTLSAQSPFAVTSYEAVGEIVKASGGQMLGHIVYEANKTAFRSEIDQALRTRPDHIFLNGYIADVTILLRELYRAGYDKGKSAPAFAINPQLMASLPPEVTEGATTWAPSPDLQSDAFSKVRSVLGTQDPDPYSCQTYDHVSMAILSIAAAGATTGEAMRGAVRKISQGDGIKVTSAVEGLRLLGEGKAINFEGASGPCDFTDTGDIIDCKFRFEQAKAGKLQILSVS